MGEALTWEEAKGDANRDRSGENIRVGLDLVECQDCIQTLLLAAKERARSTESPARSTVSPSIQLSAAISRRELIKCGGGDLKTCMEAAVAVPN